MVYGWPFLVARGRRRGYRTVLAPSFLTERRLHGVLADAANGELTEAGRSRSVEVDRPDVGRLTLVYRSEQLAAAELDDGPATDEHGRPLEILYGLVCRGRVHGDVESDELDSARREALGSYRRFLAEEDGFAVAPSEAFPLSTVSVAAEPEPAPARAPRPIPAARVQARRALALLAVALVALLAAMTFARRGTADVVSLKASVQPASLLVDCAHATSVALKGTVETDGAAEVKYRWHAQGWPGKEQTLTVKGTGPHELPVEYHDTMTADTDRYTLVVDEPQRASTQALACTSSVSGGVVGIPWPISGSMR